MKISVTKPVLIKPLPFWPELANGVEEVLLDKRWNREIIRYHQH